MISESMAMILEPHKQHTVLYIDMCRADSKRAGMNRLPILSIVFKLLLYYSNFCDWSNSCIYNNRNRKTNREEVIKGRLHILGKMFTL